jgi:hypothetical protein
MPPDPNAQFDQSLLDLIEHSPVGAVPRTTHHQDALKRLSATNQVYPDADHAEGYVTARSLARLPHFQANNLDALIAGQIAPEALESNGTIFDRYVRSLPAARQAAAEALRVNVAGRPPMHRAKVVGDAKVVAHDPVHTLFLVPGVGPKKGIPGNYLYGYLFQLPVSGSTGPGWTIHLHDSDHDAAIFNTASLAEALAKLQEVMESAPFHLVELEVLGFDLKKP